MKRHQNEAGKQRNPKLKIARFTSPLDELQHFLELKALYLQKLLAEEVEDASLDLEEVVIISWPTLKMI